MAEIKDEVTMREPKLDDERWGVMAVRVHVDGTYDARATRTTLHMLDEDCDESIAVEQCGVIADEPDVYKAFLVRFTIDDEFEGRAKVGIDVANQQPAAAATTTTATAIGSTEQPPTPTPKPSTPLTNVTSQHNQQQPAAAANRGLRLQNPKGESWRQK